MFIWTGILGRFQEMIAKARALDMAYQVLGLPTSLPEMAVLWASIAELIAASRTGEINAKAFGAKGDGVADDSNRLQAVWDAASAIYVATGAPVNVYLPHGTFILGTYQGDSYTLLKARSGVGCYGPGVLKVKDGVRTTGTGTAVLYNNDDPLANITYRDFTVDFNGQNNLFVAGYGTNAGINRLGGQGGCTNILCDNLTLKNSAGRHFILFGGAGSSNVIIRNPRISEFGQSIVGNQVTDHSAIYLDADQSEIVGAVITNSNVCEISTAIETHGSVEVHSVYVKNAGTAWNLGGDVRDTRDVIGHDLRFRNVRAGIIIYTASNFALSHIRLHDFTIAVREPTGAYPAGAGIDATSSFNASSVNVANVELTNFEIFQETTASLTAATIGIHLQRMDDVLIQGGHVHNMVAEGLLVESESTPRQLSRLQVKSCTFDTCGITSTAGRKRLIGFNSINAANQKINDIDLLDCTLRCAAGSGTVADHCVAFNGGSFPNTRIKNNTMKGFGLLPYTKAATIAGDLFLVVGEGAAQPWNNLRASIGSEWVDTTAPPYRKYIASEYVNDGSSSVWTVQYARRISADKGDASVTLVDGQDESDIWYNTPITAARDVTLPAAAQQNRGCIFKIIRSVACTGAFNLNIRRSDAALLAALTAAGQTVTMISTGAVWRIDDRGTA